MISLSVWWWLALPLLFLPIWWHRQKRQSNAALNLATAKFLQNANPQQRRIWRWRDIVLLVLRCLLLLCVIALMAELLLRWRGDTVLIAQGSDAAWVEQEIRTANMMTATRIEFCEKPSCAVNTNNLLDWLQDNQMQWKSKAKLLVLATANQVPLNARLPKLGLDLHLRISSKSTKTTPTLLQSRSITLKTEKPAQWKALFASFESAGAGTQKFSFSDEPTPATELIIWDSPQARNPKWHAPLWWTRSDTSLLASSNQKENAKELPQPFKQLGITPADTAQGRVWTMDAQREWPVDDIESAKQLYQLWQQAQNVQVPYFVASQDIKALAKGDFLATSGNLREILLLLIAGLFALERYLSHARRV
jgi:hypothetical protein